ncbi:tetratricopeptide repeat protein [Luteolibacter luteus]|uniref:Tetratricopeptide repeat protein n=1 Tax=Luteolibacter luteus TaxID=2728835 RepID=A0A858RF29_9BACT|nr:tetratricopeptide repeat protein [Luteolibacter luteus]QJE95447.1 tetratricopeptide repeat protein [Luteolibacter luteus]
MRFRPLLVIPLVISLATAAAPKPENIPAFRDGLDAMSARLWEVAVTRFEAALATPELDAAGKQAILLRLIETRIRANDADEALKLLADPALAGNPGISFWKAQALASKGQLAEAVAALDEKSTGESAPHRREALFTRAALQQLLGDLSGALEALQILSKEKDPATVLEAKMEIASILLDQGKGAEALATLPPPNAKMTPLQAARAELLRGQAQLALNEHQAAAGIFSAMLKHGDEAFAAYRQEATVGLARAQLAAGNREAAIDGLIAFIELNRDSPKIGEAFPLLMECLPAHPATDDVILTRLDEWCRDAPPDTPIGLGTGSDSSAVWPSARPSADELETQALFHLAIGLRREGSAESKFRARQLLTRLRIDYPNHPLARRALLEISRWDLADGRKEQAEASLSALDEAEVAPAMRAEAFLSAATTAFDAGDFTLASGELEKAAALLDGEGQRQAWLNTAVTRLAAGDLPGFDTVSKAHGKDPRIEDDLALERTLFLTAKRDPAAMEDLDKFIIEHPQHPRIAEARLAAAHAALENSPPDPAFAKAQIESISEQQAATLPQGSLVLAKIRVAAVEKRWADAAQIADAYLKANPKDPQANEIRYEQGNARFKNGDFNQARLELEKLAMDAPDGRHAQAALLLAARSAALGATAQAKQESIVLFDKLIAANGELADAARLLKTEVLSPAEAAKELLPWFQGMKKDDPRRLIAGLHLGDALFNSAGTDNAPLEQALAIYEDLLANMAPNSSSRFEVEYLRGRVLEELPDSKDPSKKRLAEALDVYFSVLQDASKQAPANWKWVDLCGMRARGLLESAERWEAAIAVAEQHAKLASPRAQEAAERAKQLKLEHFHWEK